MIVIADTPISFYSQFLQCGTEDRGAGSRSYRDGHIACQTAERGFFKGQSSVISLLSHFLAQSRLYRLPRRFIDPAGPDILWHFI